MTSIWINAGELSGDMQGASLLAAMRAIDTTLVASGMGGPLLMRAGQKNLLRTEDLSVMGIVETFSAIPRALFMLRRIRRYLAQLRPDAVILVDAPEFNFKVAKIACALDIPVYYFIPPKIWAWRTGRVNFLKHYVRRLFCILPFEPAFYEQHGVSVTYMGNPLVDMVDYPSICAVAPIPGRVGLMPGSRHKEVEKLMPVFGEAARLLLQNGRPLTFHCLCAPNLSPNILRNLWPRDIPLTVESPKNRYRFMRTCTCMLAASGTATLETALAGVPTVVTYKVSPLSALLGKYLLHVPWVSLPNLILQQGVFPELLQNQATGPNIASHLAAWLDNPAQNNAVRAHLEQVRVLCGAPGSAQRAAAALLQDLTQVAHP